MKEQEDEESGGAGCLLGFAWMAITVGAILTWGWGIGLLASGTVLLLAVILFTWSEQ